MKIGLIKINTTTASGGLPVAGVSFAIKDKNGDVLYSGVTDADGNSELFELPAPNAILSQTALPRSTPYSTFDVWLGKTGYHSLIKKDVQIFEDITTIVGVEMAPLIAGQDDTPVELVTPPQSVALPTIVPCQKNGTTNLPDGRVQSSVIVPDYITVHLGTPSNTNAANVRVRFSDYIKNVACSEIYPTWPNNAIIANINVIVTFALNRIYTEWYRARGYSFDITNSTATDMAYVHQREIFTNIAQMVDGLFNVYAHRQGFRNPYFTSFCNGTTATCNGLSQWGTVDLARQGYSALEILRYYYPKDIILSSAPAGSVSQSYPGSPLRTGSSGTAVRRLQTYLNRIRGNYPLIPQITNVDGVFGSQTEASVRAFQRTFNLSNDGVVGVSTWNKISQVYTAVTGLSELNGEGERIGLSANPPSVVIRQGSRGTNVMHLQFLLNYIAQYYPNIAAPVQDSIFGVSTTAAVRNFQQWFGLTADGIVGPATWQKLYQVYRTLTEQHPEIGTTPVNPLPWPDVYLRQGSRGDYVITLQNLLNQARQTYPQLPWLNPDGIFGPQTNQAVRMFQQLRGLTVDGIVGPDTWNALTHI